MYLKARIIGCLLLLGAGLNLLSQGLSHQVIVPVAGLQSAGKVHYSQTAGEAAVEVIGCTEYIFTQGFQQPGIVLKKDIPPPGNGIKVYPNPVTDFVTIELFGSESRIFLIDFINISGSVFRTEKIVFNDQYWLCQPYSVENYSKGLFLIRIMSTDGLINRTFKIEKL